MLYLLPLSWLVSYAAGKKTSLEVWSERFWSVSIEHSPVWYAQLLTTQGNTDLDPWFSAYISENRTANQVCREFLPGCHHLLQGKNKPQLNNKPGAKSLFCQTIFCMQLKKCWQLPFRHIPISFLSAAEDNFLTQLFGTLGYSKVNILVKITSKNQRSKFLCCYAMGSL